MKGTRSPGEIGARDAALALGEPTGRDTYERFCDHMRAVSTDKEAGLVTIAAPWEVPQRAPRWDNLLADCLSAELRQQEVERAEQSIEHLRPQIGGMSVAELRSGSIRLIEEHTRTVTLARAGEEFMFEVIDPAVVPQEQSKTRRGPIVELGVVLGGVLSFVLALVSAFWERVRDKSG
jgi:hypothetical protein